MIIKYTDELKHFNPYHNKKDGRFDFSPYGKQEPIGQRYKKRDYSNNESIKINYTAPDYRSGTRENVNKYQYKVTGDDGEERYFYTDAGAKRYAREESENNAKSKKNRLDEDALGDTNRWIRDDYEDYSNLAKNTAEAARNIGKMSDQVFNYTKKSNPRLDLSEMTDDQLRQILNRERMEQEYNNYFNQPKKSNETVQKFIKGATDFVSFGGEQAALALQIVKLARSFRA